MEAPKEVHTESIRINQDVGAMLDTHPSAKLLAKPELRRCIEACIACATVCTSCADACLAEENVDELVQCILMNSDCADVCQATLRLLMRQSAPDWSVLRLQVEACREVCNRCAMICEHHAAMHEHCRVCAQTCRRCEQACAALLTAQPA